MSRYRRTTIAVGATAIVGFALRIAVLVRPIHVLDRLFVPDDTYYTLTIARSIAHGHGPTTDGSTFTSGFQPLLGFLLAPVYWLTDNPDHALRGDLVLLVVADTMTILLLGWVAFRLAGSVAAIVAAGVWAISPVAIGMALGGLETSLAVMLEIGVVAVWLWANDAPNRPRWIAVGFVGGLAVLARIDALALLALLGVVQVWRGSWRRLIPVVIACAATVGPWWAWCWWQLGTPFPTSGEAAHRLAPGTPWAATTFAHAAAAVTTGPFTFWNSLRSQIVVHWGWGVATFVVIVGALLVVATSWSRAAPDRSTPGGPGVRQVAATLPIFAVVLLVFYIWFGVTWYFTRYLAPVGMVASLLVAVAVARLIGAFRSSPHTRGRAFVVAVLASVLAVAVTAAVAGDVRALTAEDRAHTVLDAATGFGSLGKQANAVFPAGAIVGGWQSGALGYYGADRVTVVNLHGVVNPEAPPVSDAHATARYLRRRRVSWLADSDPFLLGWMFAGRLPLRPRPHARVVLTIPAGKFSDKSYSVWRIIDPVT